MSYSSAWSKCTFSAPSVTRVLLSLPAEFTEQYPALLQHPPQLVPLAPRRTIARKEKKPKAPVEGSPEVGAEEKKKKGTHDLLRFVVFVFCSLR